MRNENVDVFALAANTRHRIEWDANGAQESARPIRIDPKFEFEIVDDLPEKSYQDERNQENGK